MLAPCLGMGACQGELRWGCPGMCRHCGLVGPRHLNVICWHGQCVHVMQHCCCATAGSTSIRASMSFYLLELAALAPA